MIESHNTDFTFNFYNDRVKELLDASIAAEPFTYVPIAAGHMELVTGEEGGAVVFGNIKEGYDILDIAIAAAITYEDIGSVTPEVFLSVDNIIIEEFDTSNPAGPTCFEHRSLHCVIAITIPEKIYENCTYYVNIEENLSVDDWSANYTANPGDTIADVKAGLEASMALNDIPVLAGAPDNKIYIFARWGVFCNDPWEVGDEDTVLSRYDTEAYVSATGFTTCSNNLKCGAVHGFGIVYKDLAGRTCSVMKSEDLNIYIPFYTEEDGPGIEERPIITFSISHKPPAWADTYEIVYYGNISRTSNLS